MGRTKVQNIFISPAETVFCGEDVEIIHNGAAKLETSIVVYRHHPLIKVWTNNSAPKGVVLNC
jgi:hypothetical protein